MNIFLTGATGALGRYLIPCLTADHSLVLMKHRRIPGAVDGVKWVYADLTKTDTLNGILEDIDCVIHLAAVTHSDDIRRYFECNETGTRNIVSAAEASKVKHFIFVSTRAISPSGGAYAQSKLAAESIVKESKLNWTIVRPSEIYDLEPGEMIGVLMRAVKKGSLIPVPVDKSLKIAPLFMDDFTDFIRNIILNNRSFNKIYNLTGPKEYSLSEFIDLLSLLFNKKGKTIRIGIPSGLIKIFLNINYKLKLSDKICRDQLDRIKSEKEFGHAFATNDFGFRPRGIQEVIKSCNL